MFKQKFKVPLLLLSEGKVRLLHQQNENELILTLAVGEAIASKRCLTPTAVNRQLERKQASSISSRY